MGAKIRRLVVDGVPSPYSLRGEKFYRISEVALHSDIATPKLEKSGRSSSEKLKRIPEVALYSDYSQPKTGEVRKKLILLHVEPEFFRWVCCWILIMVT